MKFYISVVMGGTCPCKDLPGFKNPEGLTPQKKHPCPAADLPPTLMTKNGNNRVKSKYSSIFKLESFLLFCA